MTLPWYFVLPADRDRPSGGNRYNEQLILALQRAGQPTAVVDFEMYREALLTRQPGSFFIDSLFVRDLAALAIAHAKHPRTIFIVHHLESMDASSGSAQRQYPQEENAAFTHVDTFLATSSFSERYLRKQGVSQPIAVVEPGIEMRAQPRKVRSEKMQVLMVANLIARKGILLWLQALAAVLQPTDAFMLTIVGRTDLEPAYAEACRQLTSEQPLLRPNVHFTGALPYHHVEEHYNRAWLFVSASRMETFGMALQEAKAGRIPLLTLVGGYAGQHVSSGHDGYVFGTLAEMADFFVDLIRNPARLEDWQVTIDAQPPGATYGWDDAARRLIQQLNR